MQGNMRSDTVCTTMLNLICSRLIQMTGKKCLESMDQSHKSIDAIPPSYTNALNEAATDRKVEFISSKIKSSVRQTMEGMLSVLLIIT